MGEARTRPEAATPARSPRHTRRHGTEPRLVGQQGDPVAQLRVHPARIQVLPTLDLPVTECEELQQRASARDGRVRGIHHDEPGDAVLRHHERGGAVGELRRDLRGVRLEADGKR